MSKPRAQVGREADLELLRALARARSAANTLYHTESAEVDFGHRVKDITFAPLEDVQAEVRRLSSEFGLLLWTDNVVNMWSDGGLTLSARFTLHHLDTGAFKVFEFEGVCFPLSEHNSNAAWAGEASVSYAWRNAALRIFGIPVMKRPKEPREPHGVVASPRAAARQVEPDAEITPASSLYLPYTPERMLAWLLTWADHQRDIAIASGCAPTQYDHATAGLGGSLAMAWAACRRSAKSAGITIRPLVPGDKPCIDEEHRELHDFLYAELLRDGLL